MQLVDKVGMGMRSAIDDLLYLIIRETMLTLDHRFFDPVGFTHSARCKLHKHRVGKSVLVRHQRTDVIRKVFRQHWNNAVNKVGAVSPTEGFGIQSRTFLDVVRNIGDVYAQLKVAIL